MTTPTSVATGDRRLRRFGWLVVRTWGLTIVAGGLSGLLVMGVVSIAFAVFTVPVGLAFGVVAGPMIGLVLAAAFALAGDPGERRDHLTRVTGWIGAGVAVAVTVPIQAGMVTAPVDADRRLLLTSAYLANAVIAIAAEGALGWRCGRWLAQRYLDRWWPRSGLAVSR